MKVSIIVPNFNGLSILRTCLASLVSHDRKPDQIIVVDNASTDGSMDLVPGEFPEVEFVRLGRNTGFTGANNAGIEAATGDFIVLLNNDCIVEKYWLENLLARM
jgi:GT2 family glycosyltransferase